MALDYFDLRSMRKNHPAWRLMSADSAPLIAGFLDTAFREHNHRTISESELTMLLEDYLFQLRELLQDSGSNVESEDGEESRADDPFPRSARGYLDDWAHSDKGWLRKFYPAGSDEAHYDLTPATETALQWLDGLFEQGFVGTESRLQTAVQLLREISTGVEQDRKVRIRELKRRRERLNAEIKAIQDGEVPMMDARALRERYFQFSRTARELLSDFRAVEHNFRRLDRDIRQRIAGWTGEKREMLQAFFGEHDAITQSDQGESFRAFWDFLMSPSSQEELTELLDRLYAVDELREETRGDTRLRRIHFDWMAAGEQTQRTVARLSRQLRGYLDDRAYFENRRIVQLHESIEKLALQLRDRVPTGDFMEIDDCKPELNLPLERPLFAPPLPTDLTAQVETADTESINASALFDQIVVDTARLKHQIRSALQRQDQITLSALLQEYPLREGLAELIGYLSLAAGDSHAGINEDIKETVFWQDSAGTLRRAEVPQVLFVRSTANE
ncbi:MAG: DUF3375 domain-containing protein [Spirochaeta sp.]